MRARRNLERVLQSLSQGFSRLIRRSAASLKLLLWLPVVLAFGVQADDADVPSLEFLEYLGTLMETDGEWLGPEDLDEDALFQRVASTTETTSGPGEEEVIE